MISFPRGLSWPGPNFFCGELLSDFLPAALQLLLYPIKWNHQEQTETNRNKKEQNGGTLDVH